MEIQDESFSRIKPESDEEIIEITKKPVIIQSQKTLGLFVPSINPANKKALDRLSTSSRMSNYNDNSGEMDEISIISGLNNTQNQNFQYEITAI